MPPGTISFTELHRADHPSEFLRRTRRKASVVFSGEPFACHLRRSIVQLSRTRATSDFRGLCKLPSILNIVINSKQPWRPRAPGHPLGTRHCGISLNMLLLAREFQFTEPEEIHLFKPSPDWDKAFRDAVRRFIATLASPIVARQAPTKSDNKPGP